jgi:uncharacterized coiled-coil protein SlyX
VVVMKIQKIEVASVIGLARADIACGTGVTLVAGPNMSGKSSLRDAISMALLGQPTRVNKKKDLDQLLHDGAKKGRAAVFADGELLGEMKLPKGEHVAPEINAEFLALLLDPALFASMASDARRTALFKITGCSASMKVIEPMLAGYGVDMTLFAEVQPMLRSGFPAAEKYAADKARDAKGAWRGVTGENWGSDKADGWSVEVPAGEPVSEELLTKARTDLAEAARQIEEGQKFLGQLEEQQRQEAGREQKLAELREKAAGLERAQAKLNATDADLDIWEGKVTAAAAGLSRARDEEARLTCPCCDAQLRMEAGKLVSDDVVRAEMQTAAEWQAELTKATEARDMLRRTQANDLAAVEACRRAATDLAELEATPSFDAEKLEKTNTALAHFRQERDKHQAAVQAMTERKALMDGAASTNAKAAQFHQEVTAWLAIAEAMSPEGIPAKLLEQALAPINQSLAQLSGMAKWPTVRITKEIEVMSNERAYGLCSESEKWRADTLLALAIAMLTGIKFTVLDRFDVLELKARGQLLNMLCDLVRLGSMDSVIMLGTMKEKPEGLPAEVTAHWISNSILES